MTVSKLVKPYFFIGKIVALPISDWRVCWFCFAYWCTFDQCNAWQVTAFSIT